MRDTRRRRRHLQHAAVICLHEHRPVAASEFAIWNRAGRMVHVFGCHIRVRRGVPSEFGIVPESAPPPGGALQRVRFLEREIVGGQFADLEPPRFTVEVFALGPSTTLADWARAAGRLPRDAATTPVELAGAREGLRIQQRLQMAPNDFFYFRTDQRVYALTPLGAHSAEMLDSFRLIR